MNCLLRSVVQFLIGSLCFLLTFRIFVTYHLMLCGLLFYSFDGVLMNRISSSWYSPNYQLSLLCLVPLNVLFKKSLPVLRS